MPHYPQMYPARQLLTSAPIADIPATVTAELRRSGLADTIRPGQRVAITAGSRGVANIAAILKATVQAVRTTLGDDIATAAVAEGRAMPLEQAVSYAVGNPLWSEADCPVFQAASAPLPHAAVHAAA